MSVARTVLVIGHGPISEAVAMALSAGGRAVTHVAPQPDALPFALPLLCPIPELAALGIRADLPMQPPAEVLTGTPVSLTRQSGIYTLTLSDGTVRAAEHLLIFSTRWAVKLLPQLSLSLPLRPARAHQLTFNGANLLATPKAEHLGYGTVAAWSTPTESTLIYDGLADPAQATFSLDTDAKVIAALQEWFRGHAVNVEAASNPMTQAWGLGTTPDYYPVIGPWAGAEGLWLVAGIAAWAGSLALPLASLFVSTFNGQPWPAALACVGPGRFRDNQATPTLRPQWLIERQEANMAPQFANNVRLVGGKTLSIMSEVNLVGPGRPELIATTVRTTGKSIQRPGMGTSEANMRPDKGKVRMASVGAKKS